MDDLVRSNIEWMLALARRITANKALAEDVVQDAFINAFRGFEKFEGKSSVKTWLHRITVNAALGKLRQMDRLAEESVEALLPEFDSNDCRIEAPWSKLVSTEDIVENEQLSSVVREKIHNLPESLRIVLLLRDIEGYTSAEVAEVIGISESNVKVRLHRARSALKKLLEPILRDEVDV